MARAHHADAFELNGRRYRRPRRPVVVVCIDGGDPAYLEAGLRAGVIPNVERFMREGHYSIARGTVPSFTCPNNMSIVTGAEPAVHGISGNFYLEPRTREPVMMTGPELLRSRTVLAEFARVGARVVSITSKDKLRRQLEKGIDLGAGHVSLSAQCAGEATLDGNGIEDVLGWLGAEPPDMYSAELSTFVLEAGIRLLAERRPDVTYLSLTDYVQHKHAPEEPEALAFYARLDDAFGRLVELGAVLGLVADHGMNDKADAGGAPRVVWLQDVLDDAFGRGTTRVVCPITDPFVAHHGALGGFVRVYLEARLDLDAVARVVRDQPGIESVWDRAAACRVFELPPDREGDLAVVSEAGTCVGAAERDHDLGGLAGHRLRTHGGVAEASVPFVVSEPLTDEYRARAAGRVLRSHDIFDFVVNGVADR